MMERTAGKTLFTRQRLLVFGVPLLLGLVVFVVMSWPQNVSVHDLKVKFVRFATSGDGGDDYAVLKVRNDSSRQWVMLAARQWQSVKNEDEIFQALGRFTTGHSTGESGRVTRSYIGGGAVHTLKTNTSEQVAVPLPRMGEKGWVEIFCWTPTEARRGLPGFVQRWWWRVRPQKTFWTWVRCDVPIQCGREVSYGKPLPPRVLSPDGKTSAPP
jgi:hypothetical protein